MQRQLRMLQLVGSQQVLTELVAEVNIDLIEATLTFSELLEVHIDIATRIKFLLMQYPTSPTMTLRG